MSNYSNVLQSLNTTIDFVYSNPCSWYRELWQRHGISEKPHLTNISDFNTLPLTSKADFITNGHPRNHTFVPFNEVTTFRSTSGTTGGGIFLFPRTHLYPDIRDILKQAGVKKFAYLGGVHKNAATAIDYASSGLEVITGDIHQPDVVVKSIIDQGVDTISSSPAVFDLLAPYFQTAGYAEQIANIVIYGEFLTTKSWQRITENYPKARLYTEYSFSEAGQAIGYTRPEDDLALNCYRPYGSVYCEIIDGELVVTTLPTPHPLPLIRYRTGDAARWVDGPDVGVFELTGRSNVDWVRVAGFELRYSAVEQALTQLPTTISLDHLQVTVELDDQNRIKPTIYLTFSEHSSLETDIALLLLVETLEKHWFISQSKNLSYYINTQQFLKPDIQIITADTTVSFKRPGITLKTD